MERKRHAKEAADGESGNMCYDFCASLGDIVL